MASSRFCFFFLGLLFCFGTQAQHKACPDSIQQYNQFNGLFNLTPSKTMVYTYYPDSLIRSEMERDLARESNIKKYRYDGGKISEIESQYNQNGTWTLNKREVRLSNRMGDDSAVLFYIWDKDLQSEVISSGSIFIHSYDSSNRINQTIRLSYDKNKGGFNNIFKREYLYSGNAVLPSSFIYYTDSNGNWIALTRRSGLEWGSGFDPTSFYTQPTVGLSEERRGAEWYPSVYDSTADLGNGFSRRFFYIYRDDNQRFELYIRFDNEIDSLGNVIFEEERSFTENGNLSVLISQTYSTYRYNAKGDPIQRIDSVVRRMPFSGYSSVMYKYAYYYSAGPSAIKSSFLKFPVYPNPAPSGGQLFLPENNWKKMELYTMDGKHRIQIKEVGNSSLRLPPLDSGVYVLILLDEAGNRYQSLLTIQ